MDVKNQLFKRISSNVREQNMGMFHFFLQFKRHNSGELSSNQTKLKLNLYLSIILLVFERFGLITVTRSVHSLKFALVCHKYAYIYRFFFTFCNYDIFSKCLTLSTSNVSLTGKRFEQPKYAHKNSVHRYKF